MGKTAFVFPGQGSQYVGMGRDLHATFPAAAAAFAETDARLGVPLSDIIFNGPAEELTLTHNAQPALLTVSIAAWRLVRAEGLRPDVVAGHSLGEYSALVAAGALSLGDAAFAVRRRGELMQRAVPVGAGSMAAVLGLGLEEVRSVCGEAAGGEVLQVANVNCPGQIVIAGHAGAVARAVEIAKSRGAKRAMALQVSAPFHCSLMAPAREGMREVLQAVDFSDLSVPLINNADVEVIKSGDAARAGLIKQVTAPVRWEETIRGMLEMGVDTIVELGPGRVLTGLAKRVGRSLRLLNVEDAASLRELLREVGR